MSEEFSVLRKEVENCLKEALEFDERMDERNRKRLELIDSLKDLLPASQFETFETIMNETVDAVRRTPNPGSVPPIDIDENNPLESLRQIRGHIAREVCKVMGVDVECS